ncbi:hypothetical protein LCGC14_0434840 [marine sediment metagenome]|uniref:Uncharacterized protein n=1 Tax=marine sediment metagenome TaxID=412755 RepID=A0A0F9T544_9ZZZZ
MKSGEVLRGDKWIKITIDTLIQGLIRMMDNPNVEYQEYRIIYSRRDKVGKKGIQIKYPGPDGVESILKTLSE